MTQINLLPDVKLEYLQTRRNKRLVVGISFIVIIASVGVLLLLASVVYGFQKKNLSDLNKDITTYNNQLKNTADLDKVLTIQNQLGALTKLHEDKPVVSRLFTYLMQLTPANAAITQLDVDNTATNMVVTGQAPTLDVVNTYIDTLKFTTYGTVGSNGAVQDSTKAFTNVVMSQFARSNEGTNFTITFNYDPAIFNIANNVKLVVPTKTTTRSITEQPTDLFKTSNQGGK